MPRKAEVLQSLARGRVRASMNKYNLFNMYKKPRTNFQGKTLYQQKWASKADTRAYHGEHLTETRWKQLFDPKLESVAQLDASLKGVAVEPTPVTLQTYAALEKRLEVAVFRSMFAASVRQARQFILRGDVQVNGVVVKHPSFTLRAGDVFNVAPERVLQAMGRSKPSLERAIKTDSLQIGAWNNYVKAARENPNDVWNKQKNKPASLNTLGSNQSKESIQKYNEGLRKKMLDEQNKTTRDLVLQRILGSKSEEEIKVEQFEKLFGKQNAEKCFKVYTILSDAKSDLINKCTIADAKKYVSTKSSDMTPEAHKIATSVKQILSEIVKSQTEFIRKSYSNKMLGEDSKNIPFNGNFGKNLKTHSNLDKEAILEDESKAVVNLPWQKGLFGRQDPSKHYFTPWTPRPFIGCFAILPHHIEVSFETCHAVYLRNPVARPGHSEVISPFPESAHERAYMYYARKGM
ncbi:37S ribosomal protein Nam9p, mitochondrial [[Candida] anglica]|uniref:37S ribosomal protein Nam9p, mitochondrial n=1 Tax=[Candida] anglica TaxID=148631 RepID=A0ABP0EJS6_9ASCO